MNTNTRNNNKKVGFKLIKMQIISLAIGFAINIIALLIIQLINVNFVNNLSSIFNNKWIFFIVYIICAELFGLVLGWPTFQVLSKQLENTNKKITIQYIYKICKKIVLIEITLSIILFVAFF